MGTKAALGLAYAYTVASLLLDVSVYSVPVLVYHYGLLDLFGTIILITIYVFVAFAVEYAAS